MERGQTRSGHTFAPQNSPYARSIAELKLKHKRLFSEVPVVTPRVVRVFNSDALLTQVTARFLFNSPRIRSTLERVFTQLFRESPIESPLDPGFEVVLVSCKKIFF